MATGGINIGDAVLSVTVDLSDLSTLQTRLSSAIPAAVRPATDAVNKLSGSFVDTEKAASSAATGAAKAGAAMQNAGKQTASSMREAAAEVGLLGEATGVTLPRHVRSFIGSLPGVSSALSAAFSATAVFFIFDALVKAGEKIEEFIEKPKKIAEAWRQYDQTVFSSGEHIRGEIDKEEQKLIEMTQGPVAALDFALKHLETTAFEVFKQISSDVDTAVKAMKEQSGLTNVFGDAAKDLEHFEGEVEKAMRTAKEQHPEDGLAAYNAAIALVQQKERELSALIAKRTAASGKDASAAVDGLHAEREAVNQILPLLQQGIDLDQQRAKNAAQDKTAAIGQQLAAQAKRDLDAQIAAIDAFKAAQEAAFTSGKIKASDWAVAQVQAATQATAAQVNYQNRLKEISAAYSSVTLAQAAAQESATEKNKLGATALDALAEAMKRHNEVAAKVLSEWSAIINANVAKAFDQGTQAAKNLTEAQLRLVDAQRKLQDAQSNANFSRQQAEIEQLAALGIISEKEKADKLKELYAQEEKAALDSLNQQLTNEQNALSVANQQLLDAEASGDQARIDRAQAYFDKLQADYDVTYANILSTTAGFDSKFDAIQAQTLQKASASWDGYFKQLVQGSLKSGNAIHLLGTLTAQGIGQAVTAAVSGSSSFGAAMEQLLKSALAALAGQAVVQAITEVAKGFSDLATAASMAADPLTAALAPGFVAAAHAHFLAAVKWGAVGAGAAIGGALVPSGTNSGSSSSGSGQGTSAITTSPVGTSNPNPVSITNAQRFGRGSVVKGPGIAQIGDSASGNGSQFEAVLPLDNHEAIGRIVTAFVGSLNPDSFNHARAFDARLQRAGVGAGLPQSLFTPATIAAGSQLIQSSNARALDVSGIQDRLDRISDLLKDGGSRGGNTYIYPKGDLIDLNELGSKLTRGVVRGTLTLKASEAHRVTKLR